MAAKAIFLKLNVEPEQLQSSINALFTKSTAMIQTQISV